MFLSQMPLYLCSYLDLIVKSEIYKEDIDESSEATEASESRG